MGQYRNVTTLRDIDVEGRDETHDRIILDASWAEDRSDIDACRRCGRTDAEFVINDRRKERKVNDTRWGGKPVGIRLNLCQYECKSCGGTFLSDHPGIHDERWMSKRLVKRIRRDGLAGYHFKTLARALGVAEGTVRNVVGDYIRELDKLERIQPMRILGIDGIEVPTTDNTHAVMADLWHGRPIEMLKKNSKRKILEYLDDIVPEPQTNPDLSVPERFGTWRDWGLVGVVIDMEEKYKDAVNQKAPRAKVIVDRYHIVRKADNALHEVRKNVTEEGLRSKWKKRIEELETLPEEMSPSERDKFEMELNGHPRLRAAYETRNEFVKIFECGSRIKAARKFRRWESRIPSSIREVFREELISTFDKWRNEILNYFSFPYKYSNGCLEGINRAIQQVAREGMGYSFKVLRAKVLYGLHRRKKARGGNSILRGHS